MTRSDEVKCYLCGNVIDDVTGQWCFGCKHFICDEHLNDPWGSHNPEDHDPNGREQKDEG